jgi:hypothetical protein
MRLPFESNRDPIFFFFFFAGVVCRSQLLSRAKSSSSSHYLMASRIFFAILLPLPFVFLLNSLSFLPAMFPSMTLLIPFRYRLFVFRNSVSSLSLILATLHISSFSFMTFSCSSFLPLWSSFSSSFLHYVLPLILFPLLSFDDSPFSS